MRLNSAASDAVGRFYDQNFAAFQRVYGDVIQAFRTVDVCKLLAYEAVAMGLADGMRLLDAGCGVAGPAIFFAQNFDLHIDAVTVSATQAAAARRNVEAAGLSGRVTVYQADYHALPEQFPAGSYDVVCFLESFGHSHDKGLAIDSAWRMLRSGGRLYIKDLFAREPAVPELADAIQANIRRINEAYCYHIGDLYEVLRYLRRKGFILSAVKTVDIPLQDFENLTISNEFQELTGIHRIDDLDGYAFPVDFLEINCIKPWNEPGAGTNRESLQNRYLVEVQGVAPGEL